MENEIEGQSNPEEGLEELVEENEIHRHAHSPEKNLEHVPQEQIEKTVAIEDLQEQLYPKNSGNDSSSSPEKRAGNDQLSHSSSYPEFVLTIEKIATGDGYKSNIANATLSKTIMNGMSAASKINYAQSGIGFLGETDLSYQGPIKFVGNTETVNPVLIANITPVSTPAAPTPVFSATEPHPSYLALGARTHTGTSGADNITGGAAAQNIIDGQAGDDILNGGNLADQIWGGIGDDAISGNDGDDILAGHDGNDVIAGGNGADWIWGGVGADNLSGGLGNDFLSGNEGDDVIYALDNGITDGKLELSSTNILYGGAGNDTLYGSLGTDTLYGGDGNDVLVSGSGTGDSYEDYVVALNPIVYYRLDETGGTTAYDVMGNLDATYYNTPALNQNGFNGNISNGAVQFDGSNDQVVSTVDSAIFDTTQGTVSAWFKLNNLNSDYTIFAKDGNGALDGQFLVGVDTNGHIDGRLQQDNVQSYFTFDPTAAIGETIQVGEWYMLTMTYGAGGAEFFVNDQSVGTNATLTRTDSDRGFLMGARNSSSSPSNEVQGAIDEVVWLTSELDLSGVNNLYNAGLAAVEDANNTTTMYGGDGNDTLTGGEGDDLLYGGDGLDTLFGGGGADAFIFEAISAYNDVDTIQDFDENDGDQIDVSDLLSGITINAGNISDYIEINITGDDSYYDYIMALNPLVYFRLDETAGTVATDSAGNLDGSYLGAPTLGGTSYNGAISNESASFDGSDNEIVQVADNSLFDTTEGTISAWFNVADLSSNRIVFAKDGNGSDDGQFYIGVDTDGDIWGRFQQDGTSSMFDFSTTPAIAGPVQTGQWYMLTMTYGAGGADIYLNGQLIGSHALLTRTDSDRPFLIGARNSSSDPDMEFNGSIDEVVWLTDEMNATEVANLYTAGLTATDNPASINGLYVDTSGTGTFNASTYIADFDDYTGLSDEVTMLNNGNLVV